MGAAEQIDKLRKQLRHWAYMYHTIGSPVVSDAVYDQEYVRLQNLEAAHPELAQADSPTQVVGAPAAPAAQTLELTVPMLSIRTQTDHSKAGAEEFVTRMRQELPGLEVEYIAEPKYDGLAINLRYVNGWLQVACTRGEGSQGEIITHAVRGVPGIPDQLELAQPPPVLEIRGECWLPKSELAILNKQKQTQIDAGIKGVKLFANTRNAAAGLLRRKDTALGQSKHLRFFAYGTGAREGVELPSTQTQLLQWLAMMGMGVCDNYKLCKDATDLYRYHEDILRQRPSLDYDIDGVVYKVNDRDLQEQLGYISKEPKWAVAHKYPPEEQVTTVTDITVQVGRTGKLTPVAKFEKVNVAGVNVTSATLHNEGEVLRKGVYIGAQVVIRRAGDVIPEVVQTLPTSDVPAPEKGYSLFDAVHGKCPACNGPIAKPDKGADWRCISGYECPAQLKQAVLHYCSRKAMNIDGIGDRLVDQLTQTHKVKSVADLYHLTTESLLGLDRMGSSSASRVILEIERSKITTLAKFIYALGILNVGESTAKDLADHYGSLDAIRTATLTDLQSVSDIGEVVAASIVLYWQQPRNNILVDRLLHAGVHWPQSAPKQTSGRLTGKTFVLTGTLPTMHRDVAKSLIEQHGGKIVGSVSAKTSYVLAGENAGTKLTAAENIGVPILDEGAFMAMLQ